MAVPTWTFVLTDLQGNQLGELNNADARSVVLPLNRLPTATFKIPTSHPMADYVTDETWDGLLKCYRNGVIRFCGPIVTGQEQGDASNASITVTAAGPLWRLAFRLLGVSPAGWGYGTATSPYDLGFIAQQMLAYGNSQGYTGIDAGSLVSSGQGSAGTYYFKDVASAIAELSTALDSFDFEIAPIEPANVGLGWPRIGLLNLADSIGTAKPDVIFEYGTTKANVNAYTKMIDRTNLATKGYIQQPANTDHTGTLAYQDDAAELLRGRFEALIDDGGVQYDDLRTLLLEGNINMRKQARKTVTFQPIPNADASPLDDYIVGDQIRARIVYNGKTRLDGMMRVWGITFNIDAQGNETPVLELQQPTTGT